MGLETAAKNHEINMGEVEHKIFERAIIARNSHWDMNCKRRKLAEENYKTIDTSKQLFTDFLILVLENSNRVILPDNFPIQKLREIYQRSDFDWKNTREYLKFYSWLRRYWKYSPLNL